jgi:UDP-glucose 4-epimerase
MKILVAGGTGYIGSHTAVDLIENGYEIIIADNEYNSYGEEVVNSIKKITNKDFNYYNIDLQNKIDVNNLFEKEKLDGVIHFAALKSVGESMQKPFDYFRVNNNSLINVLEACHLYGAKAFVFSSSCTVYGDVKTSPVNEETPLQKPASVYGSTKQMGEQIILDCSTLVDFKSSLLRYFNPAGAHFSSQIGENSKNPALNLIPVITETALGKRKCLEIFGNDYNTRDGSCIRDYIHVMDLAMAHTKALDYILQSKQQEKVSVFNLGIGQGVTVLEAVNAFETITSQKLNYKISPRREGDVEAIFCDNKKASMLLNWYPKYNINDIISSAWNYELNKAKI